MIGTDGMLKTHTPSLYPVAPPCPSPYRAGSKKRSRVSRAGSVRWSWQGKVLWRGDPFPSPRYPTLSLYSVSAEGARQGQRGRVAK